MTTKPKPNPFKISVGGKTLAKFPKKSFEQSQRDAKDAMRKSRTSDAKPSDRVPLSEQTSKGISSNLASLITGGSKADKARMARKRASEAATKLLTTPAKKGK